LHSSRDASFSVKFTTRSLSALEVKIGPLIWIV
jgi:hypothetical protein